MSTLAKSFFRDEARLYLLYMVAGIAAIPAGICYALLVVTGWERWWNVLPLLGLGLASALFVWKFVEKRVNANLATAGAAPQTYSEAYTIGLIEADASVAAASLIMLYQQPSNQQNFYQEDSQGEALAASHAAQ